MVVSISFIFFSTINAYTESRKPRKLTIPRTPIPSQRIRAIKRFTKLAKTTNVERFKKALFIVSDTRPIIKQSLSLPSPMHVLQPKHTKLKSDEVKKLLLKYNISISQLPKIRITDRALSEEFNVGDVVKIERKEDEKFSVYYRTVIV